MDCGALGLNFGFYVLNGGHGAREWGIVFLFWIGVVGYAEDGGGGGGDF